LSAGRRVRTRPGAILAAGCGALRRSCRAMSRAIVAAVRSWTPARFHCRGTRRRPMMPRRSVRDVSSPRKARDAPFVGVRPTRDMAQIPIPVPSGSYHNVPGRNAVGSRCEPGVGAQCDGILTSSVPHESGRRPPAAPTVARVQCRDEEGDLRSADVLGWHAICLCSAKEFVGSFP
jgi:hypothetical protein